MPLMAVRSSLARPAKAIDYITKPEKAAFVSAQNLKEDGDYAAQLERTAAAFGKNTAYADRKYYHFKLSPDPKDGVSAEQCQRYAEAVCARLFSDYECVIATHTDSGVIHSHIVLNSVSFDTGLKFHATDNEYGAMKDIANEIGLKHGMSVTDWRKPSAERILTAEAHLRLEGKISWKDELREVISLAKQTADNIIEFEDILSEYGVVMPRCTAYTVSFLHPEQKKAIRGERLGADYTREAIEKAFTEKEKTLSESGEISYRDKLKQNLRRIGVSAAERSEYLTAAANRYELSVIISSVASSSASKDSFKATLRELYGVECVFSDEAVFYRRADTEGWIKGTDINEKCGKENIEYVINEFKNRSDGSPESRERQRRAEAISASLGGNRGFGNTDTPTDEQAAASKADGLSSGSGEAEGATHKSIHESFGRAEPTAEGADGRNEGTAGRHRQGAEGADGISVRGFEGTVQRGRNNSSETPKQ